MIVFPSPSLAPERERIDFGVFAALGSTDNVISW